MGQFCFFFSVLATMNPVLEVVLPKQCNMLEAVNQSLADNNELDHWMQVHNTSGESQQLYSQGVPKIDQLSLDYADIIHSGKRKAAKKSKKLEERLYFSGKEGFEHVLYPYFLETIHKHSKDRWKKQDQYFKALLEDPSGLSCPAYSFINKRLTDRRFVRKNKERTASLLHELERSNNFDAVKSTLKVFLRSQSKRDKKRYEKELMQLSNKFQELNDTLGHHFAFLEQQSHMDKISTLIKRRHCSSARKKMIKYLWKQPPQDVFPEVKLAIDGIFECYKGKRNPTKLWISKTLISPMGKAYGEEGKSFIKLYIAQHYWNENKFRSARWIVDDLSNRGKKSGDLAIQAESLYLGARIDDNQQLYEEARKKYEQFLEQFPEHPRSNGVKDALLLNYISRGQWQDVYSLAASLVYHSKGEMLEDKRATNPNLEYALFWAGRSAMELGKRQEAVQYWKYATNEFFSSYYGAMAHYMLEQHTNNKYAPQPLRDSTYGPEFLQSTLSEPMQLRIKRIETLLKLGLQDQAACEVGELQSQKSSLELQTMRSLLLHASGKWLDAIKIYRDIPRSYRKKLPYGIEKILFPKRYAKNVEHYSNKTGIDPDLVFSVIRQESVFNPKAFSGAGARGLMQLMKNTARYEAKKLKKSYVSYHKKKSLMRKTRWNASLFDIETNIILGTHYLNRLLDRFDAVPISLAAYNAGPTISRKWEKRFNTDDSLYFIERIPYEETRNYVKLILRNYFYYKKWYGGAFDELPYLEHLLPSE
ncbi:MAG: lytic transglycosylase domain-containing protein [Oligoflexales bacterium]|nr:lytic transglycosylase domain-containing protein [Oligoflexales bacterium]